MQDAGGRMQDAGGRMQEAGGSGDLGRVREGWDEVEAEETRLLRQMTVQESLAHWLALQRAFEPQFRETESLFRAERMAYLEELQRRLAKLEEWRGRQPTNQPTN